MKILIADKISDKGIAILKDNHDVTVRDGLTENQLLEIIADYDAIVVRSKTHITKKVMDAAEKLMIVGRAGTGVDNIDVKYATKKKIYVMNTPAANSVSVAEHTIGLMLALLRNISKADSSMKQGKWEKKSLKGNELYEKNLGLIGLGRIGSLVAERLSAFGMKILVYDPYVNEEIAKKNNAVLINNLPELLKESDIISIHVPLTPKTKDLIGKNEFAMMKKSAIIINCARGGIINENALHKALNTGKIAGAALDVYENEPPVASPLLKLENILITPHLGASTQEAQDRAGVQLATQIINAFKGKFENVVNRELVS